ncbi:hybrid sensor histidine kinase/response regulator transcription factor [Dysgonomonas macrotermitis]|uniref:histidine kinase n=1 Tax=Dysgonomonas macrotermitis TaxID=1346286 RepID=A0A1M4SI28_9BACT|nr:hybrid sensor histidine kinase/response regulator transcription factor [Dysgonomonas macrotermitis]SHE31812.1 Signal transduction histidine kinase [Dysgonomonas macrotermitis]
MKHIHQSIILLILCAFIPIGSSGQNKVLSRYLFTTITIDEGLPVNFIDDMYRDSKGFLWVSTQGGGLSRYDGYDFLNFNVNSSPVVLKSNFIRETCEDDFNRLWVISDLGLDIIDLKTMSKSSIVDNNQAIRVMDGNGLFSVYKDSNGNIWITGENKIYRITFTEKGLVKRVSTTNQRLDAGNNTTFSGLCQIDNSILVARQGIIYNVIVSEDDILYLHPLKEIPDLDTNCKVSAILKTGNFIWIGTDRGLFRYDTGKKESKWYINSESDPSTISQNMITDLVTTREGTLVVSTLRGVNFYDSRTDSFERISHNTPSGTINSDFVNCLLSDGNVLWIGTEAGGMNKMTLRRLSIHNYVHNEKDRSSISANPVNAITEDHMGNLWVGTVEGGLNLKKKGESSFIHYTYEEGLLSHNTVSALVEDNRNKLWIGTWGNGLNVLDLSDLRNPAFRHLFSVSDEPGLAYISSLSDDHLNDGIWIGARQGIFFYDLVSGKVISPLPPNIRNRKDLPGAFIDKSNILWMGTEDGLLQVNLKNFDKKSGRCTAAYLRFGNNNMDNLFLKNVTTIYQSRDGRIWLGSKGYGFCILELINSKWEFELYTTKQGLPNNMILGILEDQQGLIWMSTGYGLSSYNPKNNRIINYTKNDGLNEHQFYWNASYKSPTTNNLYFGNMNGLSEINTNMKRSGIRHPLKVVFTKLQILNQPVWVGEGKYLQSDISYSNHIRLHESDKSFSVDFSALDYENPTTITYSYRLVGFDEEWINVPANRRFASFTNLQPGTYSLEVRCMSGDNTSEVSVLTIEVHPYFYKTVWFITLVMAVVVFCIFRLYRWRISMLKKQKEVLHLKVEERTRELANRKQQLEEQAKELTRQNEVLIEQNDKISNQRKQLIKMSDKIQDALNDKVNFFTNITHEFRTPITLIIGPIEKALKLSTNPKVIEQLHFVSRNSKHLLSLVNQLMDFRKVESEQMGIVLTQSNFLKFLEELIIPFDAFAYERGIVIEKYFRLNPPQILFDEEAMHKVITNLLSNALKFMPLDGSIRLYVTCLNSKTKGKRLYISVNDNGTGIKERDLGRIFDRFYQSKDQPGYTVSGQSGTGIGLYLCKNIIELQDGIIYAKNNHLRGASFRILLPLDTEYAEDKIVEDLTLASKEEYIDYNKTNTDSGTALSDKLAILVVEDNTDMRSYIISILSDYYNILEAENGEQALSVLRTEPVDFIISDLMMPVMDGLELSRRVKEDFSISHIPFLMLTAKTSKEARIASYKTGVDEYLQKPFDEEILLTRIHNILDTRKLYQRRFSLYMNTEDLNLEKQSKDQVFLDKALEVVKKNYKNPDYEVGDFIRDMNVGRSLLSQKMQTLTGQPASQFIRNYRLNLAREIIMKNRQEQDLSIAEIAYDVGFNDPKYFTRCFTRQFGISPSSLLKS